MQKCKATLHLIALDYKALKLFSAVMLDMLVVASALRKGEQTP